MVGTDGFATKYTASNIVWLSITVTAIVFSIILLFMNTSSLSGTKSIQSSEEDKKVIDEILC
jgi:hypothetical protein